MNREKMRAIMILNEINVECARTLNGDKYPAIQERINEVRDILIEDMFPTPKDTTIEYDINWGDSSKS